MTKLFLLALVCLGFVSCADVPGIGGSVVPLAEGQPAPFSGLLYGREAPVIEPSGK